MHTKTLSEAAHSLQQNADAATVQARQLARKYMQGGGRECTNMVAADIHDAALLFHAAASVCDRLLAAHESSKQ